MNDEDQDVRSILQFKKAVDVIQRDAGCTGVSISSHAGVRSTVTAYCEETDQTFDVVDVDYVQLPGCGCVSGISLKLRLGP